MKIEVDREACISVATCVQVAPNTFELDDEGIAIIKGMYRAAFSQGFSKVKGVILWKKKKLRL